MNKKLRRFLGAFAGMYANDEDFHRRQEQEAEPPKLQRPLPPGTISGEAEGPWVKKMIEEQEELPPEAARVLRKMVEEGEYKRDDHKAGN